MSNTLAPLILSLELDANSFEKLDALRRAHFPPARNVLSAHLTLFHALPGEKENEIGRFLGEIAARTPNLPLQFPGVRFLGRGVAAQVVAPELELLRRELSSRWRPFLSRQDAQTIRPHVTIQNKVTPEAAKALFQKLEANWKAWEGQGTALLLWRYRGGPWEAAGRWGFSSS